MKMPIATAAVSRAAPAPSVRRPMNARRSSIETPRMSESDARDRERDAPGCDQHAVSSHGSFDLVQPADAAGDARGRVERHASSCRRGKLEGSDRGHAQLRALTLVFRRGHDDAANLREHLDEDYRRHDGLAGEVTLEIEI